MSGVVLYAALVAFGFLAGATAGLLGVGGGIMMIPFLTLVVGVVLCFGGHRFFRFLMVLVGITVGFILGASGVAAVTRGQFLDSLWAWLAAIVVGLFLGGLAIPFYAAGVASRPRSGAFPQRMRPPVSRKFSHSGSQWQGTRGTGCASSVARTISAWRCTSS